MSTVSGTACSNRISSGATNTSTTYFFVSLCSLICHYVSELSMNGTRIKSHLAMFRFYCKHKLKIWLRFYVRLLSYNGGEPYSVQIFCANSLLNSCNFHINHSGSKINCQSIKTAAFIPTTKAHSTARKMQSND